MASAAAPGVADAPLRYHWLRMRATVHPTEDPAKVRRALRTCSGLEPETFDDRVEETALEAFHGGETRLLEVGLQRAGEIRGVLHAVLDEEAARQRLLSEADRRLDDDCVFYFRLDKQAAYAGDLQLADGDDAVQARLRLEVHPVRRENALAELQRLLTDGP